jgi:hypothetical protein
VAGNARNAPQPLVASLLLLMGAPSRPAPVWLSVQCGHLLSRALMRNGGVAAVLAHLGSGGDRAFSFSLWSLCFHGRGKALQCR